MHFLSAICCGTFLILFPAFHFAVQSQNESFTMTQIGANNLLSKPWDLHYAPDGYLWVTEREAGIVVRINPETAARDELIQIPDIYSTAGQDGLLGMAFHDDLLTGSPYIYLSYTYYEDSKRKQKIVRYTYQVSGNDGALSSPMVLIDNLPSSNDHNSGRLIYNNGMLYYTIGDQGTYNSCNPNLAQSLPTQEEINASNWENYPGKVLRLNPDGSIPDSNPVLNGVKSHIYSYGHRNPQGIVFGSNGILYSDEHGPNTDDEINIIYSGKNYGWPFVAGYKDNQLYDYCEWSALTNCSSTSGSCPSEVFYEESDFTASNFQEPLLSMFAVPNDYDFNNPMCSDAWMCRPNVAPSSIGVYESDAIPSWKNSLLVTSLKRGRIYRLKLDEAGTGIVGDTLQYFYTQNRYRDITFDPDGKSFYLITDSSGKTSDASGYNLRSSVLNPGAILKFTIDEGLSVSNAETVSVFRISPNPASKIIHINLKQQDKHVYRAELINTMGQRVMSATKLHYGSNEINTGNIPGGMYILKLYTKDLVWKKRIILY